MNNNCLYITVNYILNKTTLCLCNNNDKSDYTLLNGDITKSVIIYHICPDCGYKFSNIKCVCGYKYTPISHINK